LPFSFSLFGAFTFYFEGFTLLTFTLLNGTPPAKPGRTERCRIALLLQSDASLSTESIGAKVEAAP
jgi:hypothetical protein